MIKNKLSCKKALEVLFLHFVLLIYSTCSIFSKIASRYTFLSFKFCIFLCFSLIGLGMYAILWQQVLKKFSLVVAYANKSFLVVWGILWGVLFFNENITINMIIGALMIIIGIVIMVGTENEL